MNRHARHALVGMRVGLLLLAFAVVLALTSCGLYGGPNSHCSSALECARKPAHSGFAAP